METSADRAADRSGDALVEAPTLRSQVYERLREAILTGELAPGERISPAGVARRFGVSAMPVRDALRQLEQDGLVEIVARRWTRVIELDPELVEELVTLASLLERHAVASAKAVSDEQLEHLRHANAAFAAALSAGDVPASLRADGEFHDGLVALAANRSLERALRDLRTRTLLLRPRVIAPEFAAQSVADHQSIIERLERGDREGAARAVGDNWRRGLDRFRAAYAAQHARSG
jgi:DNA-binding GntR family transcriptional regulator